LKSELRDIEDEYKHWKVDWEISKKNINIERELRDIEDESKHWKVDWEISKMNINIEKWIERLRRGI
jgi:formiminotetrahydrofolate cyclodeaminase